jgi:hypothetical protein
MSTDTEQTAVIYLATPPTKYKGRHRRTWTKRAKGTAVSLSALLAAALTVGCGVGVDSQDAPPLDDNPSSAASAAGAGAVKTAQKAVGFGDGQHKVGTEIKPGTYIDEGPRRRQTTC